MAISAAVSTSNATTTVSSATSSTGASIAQNFTTFLQLLTTQLRNQNPLDPLDTNQFTQQLVQFAQVEQQMSTNSSLQALITLQLANQSAAAMSFLGATVRVEGATTALANGKADWTFTADKAATATITVKDATGATVYTENRTVTAGQQSFSWNGRNSSGATQPDGNYTISITAKDASGQAVSISTLVDGVVDGVDLNQYPPVLSVGKQTFTIDQVKQVRRTAS
ncbi:MAG: flagellar hook assembly protein FlgD [Variibacter sp.]|nr:flagellar hook assembly protein FlgD [Variibacter sp.]